MYQLLDILIWDVAIYNFGFPIFQASQKQSTLALYMK